VQPVGAGGGAPAVTAGAVVLVSSGTTGASKLAVRGAAALDADAMNVAGATRLGPEGRVLLGVPACHSYGLDTIVACVLTGAAIDVLEPFDTVAAAGHLARHATVFPGVPAMFEALGRCGPPQSPDPRTLVFSAGSPLSDRVRDSFESAWRLRAGELYGASELGTVTFSDPAGKGFVPGHVGSPLRGVSIRILDPSDARRVLSTGATGQVAVRAPSMFGGYLDGEAPLTDGHFLTGDLGRLDERGRLFITGRLKLLIDVGGLKVNPQEVEAALASHPGVAECVVVALPLSDTVTRLRAVYIPREPGRAPEDASLREFLRSRLAPHQVPRVIEPVTSLPRSPTGKVLRAAVAAC
jgi:long-chain acyl-CoA synthetase